MFNGIAFASFFFAEGGGMNPLLMFAAIAVVWVFIVILPGRKERKAKAIMLANLKKGERVLMQAGIVGKVTQAKDDHIVLDCGGAKITFLRNTVVRIIDTEDKGGD